MNNKCVGDFRTVELEYCTVHKRVNYHCKIEDLEADNSRLRAALDVVVENFNRDLASDNFLGDDDHEMMRVVKEALAALDGRE